MKQGESLLQRAREAGNPLINGRSATFVWHGKTRPSLISDLHAWEVDPRPLARAGEDIWALTLELPADAYLEYDFLDRRSGERLGDPLNPHRIFNGIEDYNHYFYMPEARPTPYTRAPEGGLHGELTRHTIADTKRLATSKKRRVYLYHPPAETAVPLLVVYDGLDYFRRGRLVQIVDNLIAAKQIQPLALALLQIAGQHGRMVEYGCSEPTIGYLLQLVLPLAASEIDLLDPLAYPGAFGIMGASMGGLMALYTALRAPHIFGKALCQAGAYQFGPQEAVVMDMVRHFPRLDVRLWLDCGRMDFLREASRNMSGLLAQHGYDVTYRENGGAHNYTTWRNAAVDGLVNLFRVKGG